MSQNGVSMTKLMGGITVLAAAIIPSAVVSCNKTKSAADDVSWTTLEAIRQFSHKTVDIDLSVIKTSNDFTGTIKESIVTEMKKDKKKKYEGVTYEYFFKSVVNQELTVTVQASIGSVKSSRNIKISGTPKE